MSSDLKPDIKISLSKYFAGEDVRLSDPEFLKVTEHLSPFTQQVLRATLSIPRGTTVSYSQLAVSIGRPNSVRAVASALGRNPLPILIPCHRVIARNGLGGFAFGIKMKRFLLDFESETKHKLNL